MKIQNRNGVLGLETAKQVMVTFLVLAVTGIAIILSLTALDDSIGDTVDQKTNSLSVTNETGGWANLTGYELSIVNVSNSAYTLVTAWGDGNQTNGTQNGLDNNPTGYSIAVPLTNVTVSTAGLVTNATSFEYPNLSLSYTYTNTYSEGRVSQIVGNVSGGLVTFFGSTGTIFSILIVVVIILAISIIIWAVGRFGQQTNDMVNL